MSCSSGIVGRLGAVPMAIFCTSKGLVVMCRAG
jgi:hypothetical protein